MKSLAFITPFRLAALVAYLTPCNIDLASSGKVMQIRSSDDQTISE